MQFAMQFAMWCAVQCALEVPKQIDELSNVFEPQIFIHFNSFTPLAFVLNHSRDAHWLILRGEFQIIVGAILAVVREVSGVTWSSAC